MISLSLDIYIHIYYLQAFSLSLQFMKSQTIKVREQEGMQTRFLKTIILIKGNNEVYQI